MKPGLRRGALAAGACASAWAAAGRAWAQPDPEGPPWDDAGAETVAPAPAPGAPPPTTVARLGGEELAERGAANLAKALDELPDLNVRLGGRGEWRLDLRGARNRSVLVRIDGIPVDEPYFGALDLGSIPVTDTIGVDAILAAGVDEVHDPATGRTVTAGRVELRRKLRPNVRRGRVVLYVERAGGGPASNRADWIALKVV